MLQHILTTRLALLEYLFKTSALNLSVFSKKIEFICAILCCVSCYSGIIWKLPNSSSSWSEALPVNVVNGTFFVLPRFAAYGSTCERMWERMCSWCSHVCSLCRHHPRQTVHGLLLLPAGAVWGCVDLSQLSQGPSVYATAISYVYWFIIYFWHLFIEQILFVQSGV